MARNQTTKMRRSGGVYLAVLGASLIVALMGLSALIGQRIQNRMLVDSTDLRQAELNANAAMELALLAMKQDVNWRTTYSNGNWFSNRGTTRGTCTANVTDPIDGNLVNSPDDPVVVMGIGYCGRAEQRFKTTIDPRKEPITSLRYAIAAGDLIDLQGDTLRTGGLIAANQTSASFSQVYGKVQAVTIGGSTYNGTTTQITSDKRPTMPDWANVFNYYKTNGTQINVNSIPSSTPNLLRNPSFENGLTDWTGEPPGIPKADLESKSSPLVSGTKSVKVKSRSAWYSGAAQRIDDIVKPGQQYTIEVWVNLDQGVSEWFYLSIFTKGTGGSAQFSVGPDALALRGIWKRVTATITAPAWSGNLEYAFVKIAGANSNNDRDFIIDDFDVREVTTGKFIYRAVLGPGVNPFGGGTNSQGIYWINCNGNRLVIERSRIVGTLLVINPGANSCVSNGPISWTPAVAGFPALLVDADTASDADFAINATNRVLSETENGVNYNPTGAPHDEFGQDSDLNDIYRPGIRGLVAIEDDLTYQNRTLIRGQILVGDDISNSSGELEVDFQPDTLLNPPPGFFDPYTYIRRLVSGQKAVLP